MKGNSKTVLSAIE